MKFHETETFEIFKDAFKNGLIKSDELLSLIRCSCYDEVEKDVDLKEYIYCMGILSESMGHFYTEDERLTFMYRFAYDMYEDKSRDAMLANFEYAARGYSDDFILKQITYGEKPRTRFKEDPELDAIIERYNIVKYDFEPTPQEEKDLLILDKKIKFHWFIKTVLFTALSIFLESLIPYCLFLTIGSIMLFTGHFPTKEKKEVHNFIRELMIAYLIVDVPVKRNSDITVYFNKKEKDVRKKKWDIAELI